MLTLAHARIRRANTAAPTFFDSLSCICVRRTRGPGPAPPAGLATSPSVSLKLLLCLEGDERTTHWQREGDARATEVVSNKGDEKTHSRRWHANEKTTHEQATRRRREGDTRGRREDQKQTGSCVRNSTSEYVDGIDHALCVGFWREEPSRFDPSARRIRPAWPTCDRFHLQPHAEKTSDIGASYCLLHLGCLGP